jgi:quinol monooxygenase YgiN
MSNGGAPHPRFDPARRWLSAQRPSIDGGELHMVHLTITLRSSTSLALLIVSALRALMGAVRLEPGFDACSVWTTEREDDNGLLVHYEERWADERAMQARVRSDRFTQLLEIIERAPDSPQVEFQFVARRHGLEYVEAVRGTLR